MLICGHFLSYRSFIQGLDATFDDYFAIVVLRCSYLLWFDWALLNVSIASFLVAFRKLILVYLKVPDLSSLKIIPLIWAILPDAEPSLICLTKLYFLLASRTVPPLLTLDSTQIFTGPALSIFISTLRFQGYIDAVYINSFVGYIPVHSLVLSVDEAFSFCLILRTISK